MKDEFGNIVNCNKNCNILYNYFKLYINTYRFKKKRNSVRETKIIEWQGLFSGLNKNEIYFIIAGILENNIFKNYSTDFYIFSRHSNQILSIKSEFDVNINIHDLSECSKFYNINNSSDTQSLDILNNNKMIFVIFDEIYNSSAERVFLQYIDNVIKKEYKFRIIIYLKDQKILNFISKKYNNPLTKNAPLFLTSLPSDYDIYGKLKQQILIDKNMRIPKNNNVFISTDKNPITKDVIERTMKEVLDDDNLIMVTHTNELKNQLNSVTRKKLGYKDIFPYIGERMLSPSYVKAISKILFVYPSNPPIYQITGKEVKTDIIFEDNFQIKEIRELLDIDIDMDEENKFALFDLTLDSSQNVEYVPDFHYSYCVTLHRLLKIDKVNKVLAFLEDSINLDFLYVLLHLRPEKLFLIKKE